MSIESNIKARELADVITEVVVEAWQESQLPDEANLVFWRRLIDGIATHAGIDLTPKVVERGEAPMDDATARQFGRTAIPFGKHISKPVDSVPLEYLLWLDAQPDFRVNLRRYLASRRIQAEQVE